MSLGENGLEVTVAGRSPCVSRLLGYEVGGRLHPLEALYLAYTGQCRIVDDSGGEVDFAELMRRYANLNPYAWVEFEVYYDLRRRGRIPVPGPREHSLLLRKSRKDPRFVKYLLILEESRLVHVSLLDEFVEEALRNKWEPLVAIVDRYGDITYYSIRRFRPLLQAVAPLNRA